jgi:hypothetical protein
VGTHPMPVRRAPSERVSTMAVGDRVVRGSMTTPPRTARQFGLPKVRAVSAQLVPVGIGHEVGVPVHVQQLGETPIEPRVDVA